MKTCKEIMSEAKQDMKSFKDLMPYCETAESTEQFLKNVLFEILDYLKDSNDRSKKVLDFHHPRDMIDFKDFKIRLAPSDAPATLEELVQAIHHTFKYSVKTGHPHYLNQLSSGVDIVTLAADWIISTCNTNMFTYEIAPVFVLMEDEVLNKLAIQVGWHSYDGILSPGGSINNLYACMIARHRAMPCAKELGLFGQKRLVMFVSEDAHYSNMRPGIILGIGLNNVVAVKVDKRGAMCVDDLQNRIEEAKAKGWKPFLVIATAGTTVLGAFDPIAEISKVAQEHDIWLHVDAAWGGAVMVSETHRNLIEGVHLADSVTWNPHKLMGVILQCSALLVRHKVTQ